MDSRGITKKTSTIRTRSIGQPFELCVNLRVCERHSARISACTNSHKYNYTGSEGPRRWPADLEGKQFHAEWGIEWFEPVKEFVAGQMAILSDRERTRLKALSLLRYAHDTFASNELTAKKALSDAAVLLIEDKDLQNLFSTAHPRQVAATFYPAFFTREIRGAQVVMWRTAQGQFLPAVYCPDLRTSLMVPA